jgi:hypothetical protein
MEIGLLTEFIKKSLIHYDNQNMKYLSIININHQNISFNTQNTDITFIYSDDKQVTYDVDVLGYFDNQNHIWIWGWLLSDLNAKQTPLSRELLNYGLKLEPSSNSIEHFYIKALLVNSRIQIEEDIQLETILSICSYLTKNKILFIYPRIRYLNNEKTEYVTFYYFIKK